MEHGAWSMVFVPRPFLRRAQGSGHRAWGTEIGALGMGHGLDLDISVFDSADKGTRGNGDKENKSTGYRAKSMRSVAESRPLSDPRPVSTKLQNGIQCLWKLDIGN